MLDRVGKEILYCKECGEALESMIPEGINFLGWDRYPRQCLCERIRIENEEKERKLREYEETLSRNRSICFQDKTMYNWNFAHDDGTVESMIHAKNYVEHFDEMIARHTGLLFWGDVGTGKSFMAGCIANALLEKEYTVKMTNFSTIINDLFACEDKNEYIESLAKYSLLIIDDLGAERNTEYATENVFNVIDRRYRSGKPLIVTTNLELALLKQEEAVDRQRIYDRVLEMCVPIRVSGESKRSSVGEGILTIGATAKSIKGGTAELNTALGILANNGIKGAEGGTHLRNIILSLQNPTDKAAAQMEALGVSVYDSEGNMRSMNDILGDLNTSMEGMTSEEKANIISTIFNKTDLSSVNALLANTGETWDNLQGSITNSAGAAQQMADTQLDNLQGQLTLLKSALEGLAISFGQLLMPAIKSIVGVIQNVVDWLNSLDEGTKKTIVTIALVAGALGPVLIVVGKVISAIGTIMTIVPKIGGLLSGLQGVVAAFTEESEYYALEKDDALTMNLGVNPLLQFGLKTTRARLLTAILNAIALVEYVPFDSNTIGNPALDPMDCLVFSGGHADETKISCITSITYKINGKHSLKCVGKNPKLAEAKSKNDKNISGLLNQVEENKTVVYDFVNVSPYEIYDHFVEVLDITFVSKESTSAMFLAEVLVDISAYEMTKKISGKAAYEEEEEKKQTDLDFSFVTKTHPYIEVMYKINGDEVEDFHPTQICHEGKQLITLFFPLSSVEENSENTFTMWLKVEDGFGKIGETQIRATLSGQGLVAGIGDWNGRITVTDSFDDIAINHPGMAVDRFVSRASVTIPKQAKPLFTQRLGRISIAPLQFGYDLLNERVKDIDMQNRVIDINHQLQRTSWGEYVIEPTKTNAGTRKLPMTDDVYQMFQAIIEDRPTDLPEIMVAGYCGFLFRDKNGMPEVAMHWEHRFNHSVKRYNDIFKVQMPNITPHVCRHTYCSNMARARMNPKTLQYLMGHSDISVTMNVYTHLGFDDAKDEMIRLEELEAAKKEVEKVTGEKPITQKMFKAI